MYGVEKKLHRIYPNSKHEEDTAENDEIEVHVCDRKIVLIEVGLGEFVLHK